MKCNCLITSGSTRGLPASKDNNGNGGWRGGGVVRA